MVYYLVHEIAVVAHYDYATRKILKIFFQHLQRLDVEVVGRLVQHQEVRISHQYRTEIKLALLAATQLVNVVVLLLRRKEEELQKLRSRHVLAAAQVYVIGNLRNHVNHLLVFTEFQSLLREIAEANRLADVKLAAVGLNLAQQHLDEGRFSRSVITHNTHLLEAGKVVVEVVENHLLLSPVVESLAHILAFENLRTYINGRSLQSYLPVFDALLRHLFQLVESILAVFRLVSASLRLTAHPVEFPAVEILRVLYFGSQIVHSLLPLLQIVGIIAPVGVDGAVVEFQNRIAHLVQEESVVRNHEDGLVATVQITLQPFYHLQIQVVGRLIQHQEVGFRNQHISQRHSLLLSAAELSHRLFQVGNVQLGENLFCLQHLLRIILMIEACLQHTFLRIKLRRLLQIAHLQVASVDDVSALVALFIHQHRHECRLSRAVSRHESHFLSFSDREGNIIKKNLCTKAFGEVLNV